MSTAAMQLPSALTGAALPLAYGPCRVAGNQLINQQLSDNSRIALYILGEGPWDGIDRLWINAKLVDVTDVTKVHFHNGFDGTLGAGLAPASNGGDQLVDNFWSLIPGNIQPTTFSRKAYLMLHVAPDPEAPSADLTVMGDYRTMRMRIFDAGGNQTAFQYSTNPAWMILDILVRQMLNREWTTSAAAAAGGDLTAFQKARIDFGSFVASAAWCDAIVASGSKRFECGVAWPQLSSMQAALTQLTTLSQTYLLQQHLGGKVGLYPNEPRASTFTLTSDHISAVSFKPTKSQLRAAANRFVGTFNDLNAQKSADIDTVPNSGLVRTSGVTTVKVPAGQTHPFEVGDNVDIVGATDPSFDGTIVVGTVISSTSFSGPQPGANAVSGNGYVGTTESRFAQRSRVADNEQHQLAVGQLGLGMSPVAKRVPVTIDFGNNTMERVQRLLNFIRQRNLGADVIPYQAPATVTVQLSMYSVDAGGNVAIAQLPGDLVTIDKTVSEEYSAQVFEITKIKITRPQPSGQSSQGQGDGGPDQSGQSETIDWTLLQYIPAIFSDASDTPQAPHPFTPRRGLRPIMRVDGTGATFVSMADTEDDAPTSRFAVASVDGGRKALIDLASAHANKTLANIADDGGSSRFAVAAIDGGRKALVDLASAHANKNLGNIADDGGSSRFAVSSIDGSRLALVNLGSSHSGQLPSGKLVTNSPYNITNDATVDSVDAGGGSGTVIRIFGTGGLGTAYNKYNGDGSTSSRPAASLSTFSYTTKYYVVRDIAGGTGYKVFGSYKDSILDGYEPVGTVITVASGGGGGSSGGGGGGGGGRGTL